MAKSQAKKYRDKLAREGRRNPERNRSPFAAMDMTTRKTKTKKDYMYQHKHKNHSFDRGYDGSFYFFSNPPSYEKFSKCSHETTFLTTTTLLYMLK
ncbi:hypothetical protein [Robertmurraya sp. Marseille-Q9965]